ncbi:MAG: hypothetical protein ABI780_06145 [Ardenticatenales bacterium]
MRTPWSTSAQAGHGVEPGASPIGRADRAALPATSTVASYADPTHRRATDRAARAALVDLSRAARAALTARQRRDADGGRLANAAQLETVQGQLQWLLDRLSLPLRPGAWFDAAALPLGAAEWLVADDARSAALAFELAATAEGADDDAVADASDATLSELRARCDARRDAQTAAAWTARSMPTGLAAMLPFETVVSDGQPRRALEVMRYARGDVAALLDNGVVVWEQGVDPADRERVAFEAADGVALSVPPPATLTTADDGFQLRFHDDGAGELHGSLGRRRVAVERWLLRGDAGGWLWLARGEEGSAAASAWRGVGIDVEN